MAGVFQDLLREVGLRRRQHSGEVRNRLALAVAQPRLNLGSEYRAALAMIDSRLGILESGLGILELGEQLDVLTPR